MKREAGRFPAIESAVVFGPFARGEADRESDIDIRLKIDRTMPFGLYDQKAVGRAAGRRVDVVGPMGYETKTQPAPSHERG